MDAIPSDDPYKLGGRPFLVIQQDLLNHYSDRTLVAVVTASPKKIAVFKDGGASVLLHPSKALLLEKESLVDCALIHIMYDKDVTEVSTQVCDSSIMSKIDKALRFVMDLDPDRVLDPR
jgi:mRNA-degrading endonuclease toxin of MazEF toxin-antitoxin module